MCEFCVKHGEGEKWYLQARNYSDDLLSDMRRRRLIEEFSDPATISKEAEKGVRRMESLRKAPWFIRNLVGRSITRKMKKIHFGQVLPVEDVEKIFDFTNSIVRLSCLCRRTTTGKEKRYCYGVSLAPEGGGLGQIYRSLQKGFSSGPEDSRFEALTKEEAVRAFREHEREGLCHTIWTFYTPFIGGICNCDRSDCLAMRSTVTHDIQVMFRGEYVAQIDPELCVGCRECMRFCQFGALIYSASSGKSVIDQRWCYGCGVCRSACSSGAIRLGERSESTVAAGLW
jgi:Pyruvate/2-oxoacid:ferredoxin oxidoreductase delta subunit